MIPYKPTDFQQRPIKQLKQKPIPSIQLVNMLTSLCQQSQNSYDSKNHILSINDVAAFQKAIQFKFGRTYKSLQRQLKMLGFKTRRDRYQEYQSQKDKINIPKIYRWKGKKQLLIDQQLSSLQKCLKQRRLQMEQTKKNINNYKKYLDSEIQSVIFSLVVDTQSEKATNQLCYIVNKIKSAVNQSEQYFRNMISKMSANLGSELQLYRLLIYKQGNSQKRLQQKQEDADELNQNMNSQGSQQRAVIQQEQDSKKSMVSIQMEQTMKNNLQDGPKNQ